MVVDKIAKPPPSIIVVESDVGDSEELSEVRGVHVPTEETELKMCMKHAEPTKSYSV